MPENLSRKITLHWADRYGNRCAECAAQLSHTPDQVGTAYSGTNHSALWYSIPSGEDAPRVDAATGISKFWFEVNEGDGSKNDVKDQDGVGFPLQDVVVVRNTTCFDTKNGSKLRVDIAVRRMNWLPLDLHSLTRLCMHLGPQRRSSHPSLHRTRRCHPGWDRNPESD